MEALYLPYGTKICIFYDFMLFFGVDADLLVGRYRNKIFL